MPSVAKNISLIVLQDVTEVRLTSSKHHNDVDDALTKKHQGERQVVNQLTIYIRKKKIHGYINVSMGWEMWKPVEARV